MNERCIILAVKDESHVPLFNAVYKNLIKTGIPPNTDIVVIAHAHREADIMKHVFKKTFPVSLMESAEIPENYKQAFFIDIAKTQAVPALKEYFALCTDPEVVYENETADAMCFHATEENKAWFVERVDFNIIKIYTPLSPNR